MTKKQFIEEYCNNCGSQRCGGPDSDWFNGCVCIHKWCIDDTCSTSNSED